MNVFSSSSLLLVIAVIVVIGLIFGGVIPNPLCKEPNKWTLGKCKTPQQLSDEQLEKDKKACIEPNTWDSDKCKTPQQLLDEQLEKDKKACIEPNTWDSEMLSCKTPEDLCEHTWVDGKCKTDEMLSADQLQKDKNACVAPNTWVNESCKTPEMVLAEQQNACVAPNTWMDGQCKSVEQLMPSRGDLVGLYTKDSFESLAGVWKDLSINQTTKVSNGNDLTVVGGKVKDKYITGTTTSTITFPAGILPPEYTFIYVAKYNGPNKERIFDGVTPNTNWLSGFWRGATGVAYHNQTKDHNGIEWLTSHTAYGIPPDLPLIGVDTNFKYRVNGKLVSTEKEYTGWNTKTTNTNTHTCLAVNNGLSTEKSDWAIGAMIVYKKKLSLAEVKQIETYLASQFGITLAPNKEYTEALNQDVPIVNNATQKDLGCFQDASIDKCQELCDSNDTCTGYNYITPQFSGWGGKAGCCYKSGPATLAPLNGVNFYTKK